MNSVNLVGRIGNDLTIYKTKAGKSFLRVSLAVRRKADKTDWFECSCYDKVAELIKDNFAIGSRIGITGQLYMDESEKDGKKTRQTKIFVNDITFIDSKKKTEEEKPKQEYTGQIKNAKADGFDTGPILDISADDLPF